MLEARAEDGRAFLDVARRYAAGLAIAVGCLACALAVIVGTSTSTGLILLGLGTALVSAAMYSMLTGMRSTLADRLVSEGVDDVFANRGTEFTGDDWSRLVRGARNHYRVLGTANHGYLRNEPIASRSADDFQAAIKHGVAVEILWLNPDCAQAALRNAQEERRDTIADTARSMIWFWELRNSLKASERKLLSLMEYDDLPTCGATWADDQLIVSHYLAASLNLDSPGLVLRSPAVRLGRFQIPTGPKPPLTRLYEQHYQQVKSSAVSITAERMVGIQAIEAARQGEASEADIAPGTGGGV